MKNRDKITSEVAKELGIPRKKVLEIITTHSLLVKELHKAKDLRTVYFPKLGYFIPIPVKLKLDLATAKRRNAKYIKKNNEVKKEDNDIVFEFED